MYTYKETPNPHGGPWQTIGWSTYSESNNKPKTTPVKLRVAAYSAYEKNYLLNTYRPLASPTITLMADEDYAISLKDIQTIALKESCPQYYPEGCDESAITGLLIAAGCAPTFAYGNLRRTKERLMWYAYYGKCEGRNYMIAFEVVKQPPRHAGFTLACLLLFFASCTRLEWLIRSLLYSTVVRGGNHAQKTKSRTARNSPRLG
jgi:hypothetical protein